MHAYAKPSHEHWHYTLRCRCDYERYEKKFNHKTYKGEYLELGMRVKKSKRANGIVRV
jgi:hypothetical protein